MAEVVLSGLSKVFPGGVHAAEGLELTITDGEFFALLGPSGCGKTTLLRMLAGLEAPTAGTIIIGGRDVTKLPPGERDLAMVFQDYALYPHMTVIDNIAYPLKVRKVGKDERHATAREAAGSLQLEALLDRRPGQLSGGQQQRVALARAIAFRSGLFLFDEPLSNLDARLRLEARTFLKRLQTELGVTTVYVTHDQSEALALADRMAVMEHGRFRQVGTPLEVYQRPSSRFVASFIGSVPMNLLAATVQDGRLRVGRHAVALPEDPPARPAAGDEVVVGARPEHLQLHAEAVDGALEGTVAVVELLGTDYLITLEDEGLSVQVTAPEAPPIGERAWVTLDGRRTLLYRADDGELIGSPHAGERGEMATAG
ncbi:MAG: ABC transporter ATP-binding protein [Euzebyales bacterium]|nr:ABC transporter ATP-binding protein [Euzebyales bacterium]